MGLDIHIMIKLLSLFEVYKIRVELKKEDKISGYSIYKLIIVK